jgi:hypothetical protein
MVTDICLEQSKKEHFSVLTVLNHYPGVTGCFRPQAQTPEFHRSGQAAYPRCQVKKEE